MYSHTSLHCCCACVCAYFLQVLEGWLQWSAMGALQHDEFAQAVLDLVTNMAQQLHAAGKVGALPVTAPHSRLVP